VTRGAPLLSVEGLAVDFPTDDGPLHAVDDLSFGLDEHEVVCVVGESGSGKTVTALAMLGLLPRRARVRGSVRFRGEELLGRRERDLERLRGNAVAMVFQDALAAFNPVMTVGDQVAEAVAVHQPDLGGTSRRERVVALLELVGVPDPAGRAGQYPHQFSGGMRQRAMLAMALANDPALLIADEPTTALDVTLQAQVLDVLERIRDRTGTGILLITHDLGVVAGLAERVLVLYAGRAVEEAPVDALFAAPRHPYTLGLLASLPRLDRGSRGTTLFRIPGQPPSLVHRPAGCAFHPRCAFRVLPAPCATEVPDAVEVGAGHRSACHRVAELDGVTPDQLRAEAGVSTPAPLAPALDDRARGRVLEVRDLTKDFPVRGGFWRRPVGHVSAVAGVSFDVLRGQTFALVGESGCGKTTTARLILRLLPATAGTVRFDGTDLLGAASGTMRRARRRLQIVYQDPYASLNPRLTVGGIVADPLRVHGLWSDHGRDRVRTLLDQVGLDAGDARRYPHELSGGQRQRVGIARALALEPELLVLDEPVSALDVSIQAGIVNLLDELQRRLGLTYVFIAHDLAVVRHVADVVGVMYLGKLVERGPASLVYDEPQHPYTQALLSAVPVPDPATERRRRRILLQGDVPSAADPPSGCRFRTRCWRAQAVCAEQEPRLESNGRDHAVACFFPGPETGS
jgi:peptide/nickel transport system ATP-binding protein